MTPLRLFTCFRDITKISDGIGDKLALLFQNMSTFSIGLAVGLAKGWKLTLVTLSTSPLIMASAAACSRVSELPQWAAVWKKGELNAQRQGHPPSHSCCGLCSPLAIPVWVLVPSFYILLTFFKSSLPLAARGGSRRQQRQSQGHFLWDSDLPLLFLQRLIF